MATHIRAGEIIARQLNGREFEFIFIGYRDSEGGNVLFGGGVFDFGDGTSEVTPGDGLNWVVTDLGNGVQRWEFRLTHRYAAGADYLVSYTEENRNEDIQNISGSINTAFHVETLIVIDPLVPNSSPRFTVPPIDQGLVGAVFEHNPGAFDIDDDSLSYSLVIPKQDKNVDVTGYLPLNHESFYEDFQNGNAAGTGLPTLDIDPATGVLIWDAPGGVTIPDLECREWNVAIKVQEWRLFNGIPEPLGYVIRDMQIIVCDYENEPPELEIPEDTCVVAGETLLGIVTATDPDGDAIKIEAFGGPLELSPSPATYTPNPATFQAPPASLNFEWQTVCDYVRESPYQIEFKATDAPTIPNISNPPGLSNFETWKVTVVGPAPEGLNVSPAGGGMALSWDAYACTQAESMQIWRRVGSFDIDPTCNPGVPENSGYTLIQTQDISDTDFLDTDNGAGLSVGAKYCYRLVATFPEPVGGLSIASAEACDSLVLDVPVITHVDVVSTSETQGQIQVTWTPPYQIDAVAFPPAYTYELIRAEGMGSDQPFSSIITTSDTTFLDQGLNTLDLSYSYRVVLFSNSNRVDTSRQASSVRLTPNPQVGGIRLGWEANVPWSNVVQDFPYHFIYRDHVLPNFLDSLVLIDSVDVTIGGLTYLDDGIAADPSRGIIGEDMLDEEIEYCYSVLTQGSYDNDLLPAPLVNRSQISCAQPNDTIPPCPPVAVSFSLDAGFDCEAQYVCGTNVVSLENSITWSEDNASQCDDDIQFYRVYKSESDYPAGFLPVEETVRTEFTDRGLTSLAFCYYITAVDRSGNESVISEILCNDNCPQFILPNVFTPNGDGNNDTFRPMTKDGQCPRFVESVVLTVVNRAGSRVFEYDSQDPEKSVAAVSWDGQTESGQEAPEGVYYYSAEVIFTTLNPEASNKVIKGWVQLIR